MSDRIFTAADVEEVKRYAGKHGDAIVARFGGNDMGQLIATAAAQESQGGGLRWLSRLHRGVRFGRAIQVAMVLGYCLARVEDQRRKGRGDDADGSCPTEGCRYADGHAGACYGPNAPFHPDMLAEGEPWPVKEVGPR